MRILVCDYDHSISLNMENQYPEIYVKYKFDSEPGFLFKPGYSIDEVEGLVDFIYSIIDKLDNRESLKSLENFRRICYMEWSG